MTQKEIENNQMIAEFLNFAYLENFNYPKENAIGWYNSKGICVGSELKFHYSWDWLMEVVEKIENIIFDEDNSYNVTIGSTNYCVIQDSNGEVYDSSHDNGKTKLEAVYNACIEFIKWYNEPTAKL